MAITQKEADALELKFMDAMPGERDFSKESARKLLEAWDHLIEIILNP